MREYWEFPGGKVNAEESADAALCRELNEELGVVPTTYMPFAKIEHDYADLSVAINFYVVSAWRDTPVGREGQEIRWVTKEQLKDTAMLAADAPIVARILDEL